MLPYECRTPDRQYRDNLRLIVEQGEWVKTQQGPRALRYIAPPPMRFLLSNGFPMITERNIKGFWHQAVGEIFAFVNGVRTLEELESFGCKFWSNFITAEKCAKRGLAPGDMGDGSYGDAFANFPMRDGGGFNQWKHIVEQIREMPHLRTHFVTPWVPQYVGRGKGKEQRVVIAPCHGWVHIMVNSENELSLHMFQRSADFPIGVPSNMVQYAALTMAIAHVTGYTAKEFIHSCSDAHVYENQLPNIREMISPYTRPPKRFPTVTMQPHESLFDFRASDFALSDYEAHPAIKGIPAAI